jgi:PPE-repeat protein
MDETLKEKKLAAESVLKAGKAAVVPEPEEGEEKAADFAQNSFAKVVMLEKEKIALCGMCRVTRQYKFGDGEVKFETEEIKGEIMLFENSNLAKTGTNLGATIETKQYNNGKFNVWVEIPCYVEDVDKVQDICQKFVDAKLDALISDFMKDAGIEKKEVKVEKSPIAAKPMEAPW